MIINAHFLSNMSLFPYFLTILSESSFFQLVNGAVIANVVSNVESFYTKNLQAPQFLVQHSQEATSKRWKTEEGA